MGTQDIQADLSPDERSHFMKALLRDVRALEQLIETGAIESGVRRIGAEQEMVLVDRAWQAAPLAMELLDGPDPLTDPRLTTEIARFNIEANLTPRRFEGDCLRELEAEINETVSLVRTACRRHGAEVVLTGILPTLDQRALGRANISDRKRYFELDKALRTLRGGAYKLQIEGLDEVSIEHDSVMLEALNTSFQLHYQVEAEEFGQAYNVSQAVAGPLLAACVNSPVLFGKRLWRETRIAIFQQTVDTRHGSPQERDLLARVRFGERWVDDSPLEIFKNDIARFRVILGRAENEDPFAAMGSGRPPRLEALQLHNSTVYRWNRACYGISEHGPHLRIENRVLPAGPTVVDEVANAALWFGLMRGGQEAFRDLRNDLDFDDARANFYAAARQGMHAEFTWLGGQYLTAQTLLLKELIPIARDGLRLANVNPHDISRYLDIIESRVKTRRSGAQWLLNSVVQMRGQGTRSERAAALTAAICSRQHGSPDNPVKPVHDWTPAELGEGGGWTQNYQRVEQYMTTDLFTVHDDDTIDLVMTLMDWEHIRHVPVEDSQHNLVGIVSYRTLLAHLARCTSTGRTDSYSIAVREIMATEPISVGPETLTVDVIALMRDHRISCVPVTKDGRLVGLVTEHDFLEVAAQLIEEKLRGE